MRLTLEHLHLYLLDKGYLDAASVVSGDYLATQMQTRSLIFRVTRRQAPGLFVKQLQSFDPNNTYALQKDATCLWLIKNHPAFARLATYVPAYYGFDPEKQVLVTEYLPEASNLEEHCRLHQGHLPAPLFAKLAAVLATFHFPLSSEVLASRAVQFFPRQAPWVFNLSDPGVTAQQALFSKSQTPNPALAAVLGSPTFQQALAGIQADWQLTSLIHGDLKWMNLLVHRAPAEEEQLKLIDWEIADIGDPLWDVAGVFQGFVSNALFYNPALASTTFSLVPGVSLADLGAVWPQLDQFWQLYVAHTAPHLALPADALAKTLRYTAARLVQTAIEQNIFSPTLQPSTIKFLQASYAMLTQEDALLTHFSLAQPAEYV